MSGWLIMVPSIVPDAASGRGPEFTQQLSLCLALLLIVIYVLGLVFSLKTHREFFGSAAHHGEDDHEPWPIGVALATLGAVTVLVALVSVSLALRRRWFPEEAARG